MERFAKDLINFLEETYQDAFKYELTVNMGASSHECLELKIIDKNITYYFPPPQMNSLYHFYANGEHERWKDMLIEFFD